MGHEVTGLKTYRGAKRKQQLGVCSLRGFYAPWADIASCDSFYAARQSAVANSVDVELRRSPCGAAGMSLIVSSKAVRFSP
jgi:hypothetical protein